ncbi:DUF2004 domain-containing protein [Pedobacter sp. HDW13]|uniref:DUF2004 domain-containing protein n=1 Tax=Pedobacter sp. HDW13 TaxID=2714940 RepID=UPI0014079F6D|nr:DUF2004 domain-containing protein [Pedobacter sp. HDW13]QIL37908.1 DUF2004 domain-containing protein [Pedobacter sp. HDW13]
MDYTLPYFGNLDLNALNEDYYSAIQTPKNNIAIELSFENKSIEQKIADGIRIFLENIEKLDEKNKITIAKDFEEEGSETSNYINFYLTEFDEAELLDIIGKKTEKTKMADQLLDKLELTRIALYPDGRYGLTYYAMFDYTIYLNGFPCDQLLVLFTDQQGSLEDIGWDS